MHLHASAMVRAGCFSKDSRINPRLMTILLTGRCIRP